MKKEKIIEAIQKLVTNYNNDTIVHSIFDCPLCKLFNRRGCVGCPNIAFIAEGYAMSCITRGKQFPFLNYLENGNNANLSKFWEAVNILITEQSEKDVNEMGYLLKEQILHIAKHYNRCL